jgi:hypothetical protein
MVAILRPKAAREKLGVSKSAFNDNFVQKPGGTAIVSGTKGVRRLRPLMINKTVRGFVDDEIDELIQAMAAERDAEPLVGKDRDRGGRFAQKEAEKHP